MIPSGKADDTKKTGLRPEPLCLFCFPEESPFIAKNTYVSTLPKREPDTLFTHAKEPVRGFRQKVEEVRNKQKEELWLRKRAEARIRRRKRTKEPVRNLKTYLLSSEGCGNVPQKPNLPSLIEVLEIVKDAWPSPSSRKKSLLRYDDQKSFLPQCQTTKSKMKDRQMSPQFPYQLLNRRFSMPEELMRKFSVSKERTSEESETTKTAVEVSPPSSSSVETTETVRKVTGRKTQRETKPPSSAADACQQTSDLEQPEKTEACKKATQNDYYSQGKRIIKIKIEKGCTCQKEEPASTTGSAKEETDESGTSESVPSSSPTQLPKQESSSGNVSSESDYLRCTCAELTSTSTDLFRSGKSTLSQTISDKSISTQDSTVSINSVSTGGSTDSDNSDSTTPEKRRSAKETTTSPDYSARSPRNTKNRRCYGVHKKTCPKYAEAKISKCKRQCPIHSECQPRNTVNVGTNTESAISQETKNEVELSEKSQSQVTSQAEEPERYKWSKLSQEELYMMQQLRHRRFIERQKRLSRLLPPTPDEESISVCGTGSTCKTENVDELIMIPRYSALPRTLSMIVNTSSPDTSHHSDSDNQSLADSLEDQPTTHVHRLYFDTKKESKPVRGDASVIQDNKPKPRQPRGRAFFVSIKDPFGEDEMLENIEKIPQPPENIKNQIFERHLSLCCKHRHLREDKAKGREAAIKKRKGKSKQEEVQTKKKEEKQMDGKNEKTKRTDENKPKGEMKGKKDQSRSKIPVFVSSRSTSSSPEGEPKVKPPRPKGRLRREKQPEEPTDTSKPEMEITQILEITQTGPEISFQKPQAVTHPSTDLKSDLTMPPLVSNLRIPSFRQFNKQLVLPARKSPIGKFRQRFEVIPEEKSSSLSSAEEKNRKEVLPKFADASTSPAPLEKIQFQNYNVNKVPNVIVAKFADKRLETLPCVKSDGQKIFLFSKTPNSAKGRDALIAMNQEDFNRLAKGWMNFYKLKECADDSDDEGKNPKQGEETETAKEPKCLDEAKSKEPELEEPVRLHSSCTILKPKSVPVNSSRNASMQTPLPELVLPSQSGRDVCDADPSKGNEVLRDEESDSDSTDYMEPPSPRVPPLPIGDIPSDTTLSSTDSDLEEPEPQLTTQSLKCLQLKRRVTTNKTRPRKDDVDTLRFDKKKKNSGWSVTVAGTVELSKSAPDLEMRLSFPVKAGPPVVSQSDSGFAEDSSHSKLSESFQKLSLHTAKRDPAPSRGNKTQQWMVTVRNPKKGAREQTNREPKNVRLPDLDRDENAKKEFKDVQLKMNLKRIVERKILPKLQKIIRKEFLAESERIFTETDDGDYDSGLSVIGSAVSMERKQKPPTMTERDVTRRRASEARDSRENPT